MSDKQLKHLDWIQSVINRLAGNSFQIKAWAVALATGATIFLSSLDNSEGVLLLVVPTLVLWVLDGYFLHQERLFRGVYDHVRGLNEEAIDFSMSTARDNSANSPVTISGRGWLHAIFSISLVLFYCALLALIAVAYLLSANEIV